MRAVFGRTTKALPVAMIALAALVAGGASAPASGATAAGAAFSDHVFASGAKILHATPKGSVAISLPDDITYLGHHIFVGFQNGVGPQGQASTTGNRDSTIVEFSLSGHPVDQWDVVGKCDGLTADPLDGRVIATVNEDAHSSVYEIDPAAGGAAVHYRYSEPLPSKGGTDAIEIYHRMVLISASAPGTTGAAAPSAKYPAVYRAVFHAASRVAAIRPLFFDEAAAVLANTNSPMYGKHVHLALTDPDSNEVVPAYAHRFAGDFMLTSQGDKEQVFVGGAGTRHQTLSVLTLSDSVDDTAWASDRSGAIYTTDNSANTIIKVTGPFKRGSVFVADTPCDAGDAPSTCPGPGFPANYLGELNPDTGAITRVVLHGPSVQAQGMLFLP
ncbi:MAG TPA: hypothetical protein VIJ20_02300 [Solirubrobacteraceae bacterium]